MIDIAELTVEWSPVLDLGDARFFRHLVYRSAYKRVRPRPDGTIETRYACDDEVVATLGELAAKLSEAT